MDWIWVNIFQEHCTPFLVNVVAFHIHIYMCVCINWYITILYMYACMYISMCVCVCVCMYVFMYVCVHVYMCYSLDVFAFLYVQRIETCCIIALYKWINYYYYYVYSIHTLSSRCGNTCHSLTALSCSCLPSSYDWLITWPTPKNPPVTTAIPSSSAKLFPVALD